MCRSCMWEDHVVEMEEYLEGCENDCVAGILNWVLDNHHITESQEEIIGEIMGVGGESDEN